MHLREMRVSDPSLAEVYRHDVEFAETNREVREYFFNLMRSRSSRSCGSGIGTGRFPMITTIRGRRG